MNNQRKTKIIDLSYPLTNSSPDQVNLTNIVYGTHEESAANACKLLDLDMKVFPDGKHAAWEIITVNSHSGTHVDAPLHYGPLCEGKPARTIDEIPLEWCFSDGVVLDLTYKKRGEEITVDDLKSVLAKINYTLKPFDIVLIRTDASKQFNQQNYEIMQPGMGRESTLWLIDQGIKVMGIDAWGWDRPYDVMKSEYLSGIKNTIFESHRAGREKEYWHAEKMANFDQIPRPFGFKVAIFPIKIERASAGWTRAVAIIED